MSVPVLVSAPDAVPWPSETSILLGPVPVSSRSRATPPEAEETAPDARRAAPSRRKPVRGTPDEIAQAYDDLNHALLLARESHAEAPCLGPGGEAWTSDDPDDQELAADRCLDCPLAVQCREYAQLAGETAGVWGGYIPAEARRESKRLRVESATHGAATTDRCKKGVHDITGPDAVYVTGRGGRECVECRRARTARRRAKRYLRPDFRPDFLEVGAVNPRSNQRNGHPTMNAKNPTKTTDLNACLCGCGESTKGTFRPGHDARMVSQLVAIVKADGLTKGGIAKLAKTLPSEALRAKFERAAGRATAPKQVKPVKPAQITQPAEAHVDTQVTE